MWSFRSSLTPARSDINHLHIYTRGMSEVLYARGMCEGTYAQSPCSAVRAASTARRCCGRHGICDPHLKYTPVNMQYAPQAACKRGPDLRLIHLRRSYLTQQSATCVKLCCDFVLHVGIRLVFIGVGDSILINLIYLYCNQASISVR